MRKETKSTGKGAGTFFAFVFLLFLFTGAVVIVLNFRWLYYLDIKWLRLTEASGLTEAEVKANYNALIDYNLLWHRGALKFPSLPMSENAAVHFAEVKVIFDWIQIVFVTTAIATVMISLQTKGRRRWWLRITGICGIVLPAVSGTAILIGWDRFFVAFHTLVFHNDYWLFDPVSDPVILILPDSYFLQCAGSILLLIFAGSLVCLLCSGRSKKTRIGSRDLNGQMSAG